MNTQNTPGFDVSRRDVLKALAAFASSSLVPGADALAAARAAVKDCNVLWLMSDEHNPFVTGYAGDRKVQTPAIDSIAATGCQFSAAYCPNPVCVPSRQGFHAGRMGSNIDHVTPNYEALGPYFTRMGFYTGWFGKQHWKSLINPFNEFGESCDAVVRQRFADQGLQYPEGSRLVKDATEATWGTDLNEDTVCTDQALDFLDRIGNQRFFLGVSYVKPHFPYCIQDAYYQLYANAGIPRPKVTQAMLDDLSTAMKQDRTTFGIDVLSRAQSDFARAIYYGMISYMDEQVGRVMAKLQSLGLRDKTIVIYMSDHGEMMGQHGIWYKNAFFEGSARVPVVIAPPAGMVKHLKTAVAAPVSTIDLFPTLCDMCGLPPPATLEGRSMLPLMKGTDTGADRVAFSENKRRGIAARMIRTPQFKYCYYADGMEQLYDMSGADRDVEGVNLALDDAYAAVKADLKQRALDGWNQDGLYDDGT